MKNNIKLALSAMMVLGATSVYATNGATLSGMGAEARGMAGTGIGIAHGAESALTNPALITSVKETEISFGGTLFMPDVSNTNSTTNMGGSSSSATSTADMSMIPEVSLASRINDRFSIGVGMWGTGGMGVDYRDAQASTDQQYQMVTNLQLMQFGVPLAYTINSFTVAITPILQYGSLDINYNSAALGGGQNGSGVAQDMQFGYNIGLAYRINNITLGAIYKSQIDMDYKDQLPNAMAGFGVPYTNTKLSTPAEMGIGLSYMISAHTIAIDYKQIKWSDAEGYKDFMWDDQDVVSIGYEYKTKEWSARLGYNYASSPITEQKLGSMGRLASGADMAGLINTFNLLGFPGIVESHYAVGGTYNITEQTSVDMAFTYAPEVTQTYKNFAGNDITTKHSQTGVSAQVNFNF